MADRPFVFARTARAARDVASVHSLTDWFYIRDREDAERHLARCIAAIRQGDAIPYDMPIFVFNPPEFQLTRRQLDALLWLSARLGSRCIGIASDPVDPRRPLPVGVHDD